MIKTWSKFNYGFDVDSSNQYLDFKEGDETLTAEVPFGNYTLGEGMRAVQDAMNALGENVYQVTLDRVTSKVTISGDGDFELPFINGPSAASSIFGLLGFDQQDYTGADSYTAQNVCGLQYFPQFMLQSYVPPEHMKESVDATVNRSTDGRVEVVRFGLEQSIEMEIKFITSLPMDNIYIKTNPTGLEDALEFLSYISQKKRFEFVPNILAPATFHKVILESSPGYSKGTGFKLKELISQGLADIYETGLLTLRVVQ